MKKKNLIILTILIILTLVLTIIYISDNRKTKKQGELRNFAVEDTASINKIFLANMNNASVLLERKGNDWIANGTYTARRDLLNILLQTIKRVSVRERVKDSKMDKILSDISTLGTKVEIYQNNKLTKTYYVGMDAGSTSGTYMILEGSDIPFLVEIPGFNGFLSIRYIPEINEWRERIVFNYRTQDIEKIIVEQNDEPDESFVIHNYGNNLYGLTDLNDNKVDFPVDTLSLKEYILRIKYIGFEAYLDDEIKVQKLDSLKSEPFITKYTIVDKNGNSKNLKTYKRHNIGNLLDDDGNLYEWDVENLYGIIENDSEVVILQYYIIDPINYKKSYFLLKN